VSRTDGRAHPPRRAFLVGLAALGVCRGGQARADAGLTDDERAWVAAHPVVLVAPEQDYAPFTWVDEHGRHQGLSADLLALLEPLTGLEFRVAAAAPLSTNLERQARGAIVETDHPVFGRIKMQNAFPRLSETPGQVRWPGPALGEHTDQVLGELGLSADKIADLRARGIV